MIIFRRQIDASLVLEEINPEYTENQIAEMLNDGSANFLESTSEIMGPDDILLAKVKEYSEDDITDSAFQSELE